MIKTHINLVPDCVNPSPDYYCTWQAQLYATCDGKQKGQRVLSSEKGIFGAEKPYGWAYFHKEVRQDLYFVMDDSWDVPLADDPSCYGCLILNEEKFPESTNGRTNTESLRALSERIKSLGWKGLGGWVCSQESEKYRTDDVKAYWAKRLREAQESGFAYWKVDWGKKGADLAFRTFLSALGKEFAPDLTIEHAVTKDVIPHADVFRTYDVPAIMSIPITMQKLQALQNTPPPQENFAGLINCEDEVYIAAAGGFTMGIMRHPYRGAFVNGKKDMSFPEVHRNLKTKMYEVIRAVRWHRIAPAFGNGSICTSSENLCDTWRFEKMDEELEAWWLGTPVLQEALKDGVFTEKAPAILYRGCISPTVQADEEGNVPYVAASKNPNGVFSVATLGRTAGRKYWIPKCDLTVSIEDADTVGVFGEYKNLILQRTGKKASRVLMQDLADTCAYDITGDIDICENKITVPGELISKIGKTAQPAEDTSEAGAVIKIME